MHTNSPRARFVRAPQSVALLLGGLLLLASPGLEPRAAAATVSACVAKKGTVKILKGKSKCRRAETKVSWATTAGAGAAGPQGPAGPPADGRQGRSGCPGR